MMGPGIAGTLALGGVRATILSRTEEGARKGLESAHRQLRLLEENGLADPARAKRAFELVDSSSAFDATIASVDLVIESAPENMEFKQKLFAHMDSISKPDAVLTSNTSGLSITAIASSSGRMMPRSCTRRRAATASAESPGCFERRSCGCSRLM